MLLFAIYLLIFPVRSESDIVATVFGLSLLCLLSAIFIITLAQGLSIRDRLKLQVSMSGTETDDATLPVATKPAVLVMRCSAINPLPYFTIEISLHFAAKRISRRVFVLAGRSPADRILREDVVFPHRGDWRILGAHVRFGDRFGFASIRWNIRTPQVAQTIAVAPRPYFGALPPVLSSAVRSGESLPDIQRREGELFDIKPYHPSDGIRRILWKVYAKSGQLLSRHPERSMTPEGQVVIFVLAGTKDDSACSACLSYLGLLEELNLDVYIGCQGMRDQTLARSRQQALDLFIASAWDSDHPQHYDGLDALKNTMSLAAARLGGSSLRNVIIFYNPDRITSLRELTIHQSLGQAVEAAGAEPIFVSCRAEPSRAADAARLRLPRRLRTLFFSPALDDERPSARMSSDFLVNCSQRRWQVMVE